MREHVHHIAVVTHRLPSFVQLVNQTTTLLRRGERLLCYYFSTTPLLTLSILAKFFAKLKYSSRRFLIISSAPATAERDLYNDRSITLCAAD